MSTIRYSLISITLISIIVSYEKFNFAENMMILIPAGEFTMGVNDSDESWIGPEHKVYVDSYEIDKYEVTVEEYAQCIKATKCDPTVDIKYFRPKEPIRQVSWFDANAYCKWVGKRLPTEAEWEKASRGPKGYVNPWGNRVLQEGDAAVGGKFGNVGSFKNDLSEYGVYDTAGSVSEWVHDWYDDSYYKRSPYRNPKGPSKGTEKTVRGGNFLTNIRYDIRDTNFSVKRIGLPPDVGANYIGFRCARSVSKE